MDTHSKKGEKSFSLNLVRNFSSLFLPDDLFTYETENYMTSLNCLSRNLRKEVTFDGER